MDAVSIHGGGGKRTEDKLEPETYHGFSVKGRQRVLVVPHHSTLSHGPPPSALSHFSGQRGKRKSRNVEGEGWTERRVNYFKVFLTA